MCGRCFGGPLFDIFSHLLVFFCISVFFVSLLRCVLTPIVLHSIHSEERRKNFSRRRQYYEDEDITHISERNRKFNKKAQRAYDDYTVEIRNNLERGTAL